MAVTIPLAILGLIIYIYWIWNKCSLAFPFTIIFLIEIAWGILSIIWIDSGIYITEQLRDSYTTGAAIRYILLLHWYFHILWKRKYYVNSTKLLNLKFQESHWIVLFGIYV